MWPLHQTRGLGPYGKRGGTDTDTQQGERLVRTHMQGEGHVRVQTGWSDAPSIASSTRIREMGAEQSSLRASWALLTADF